MSQTAQLQVMEPAQNVPATPMDMLNTAIERGAGIEVLEKLMALQERWEANQARKAFNAALAAAKAEIPIIAKNREVDFTSQKGRTHYRHEDLAEIVRTITPILARHGLSHRFRTSSPPNEPITVTCILFHRDGHIEENTLTGPRDESGNKNSLQSVGSSLTYLQRMTIKAALGLAASDDDDGKSAGAGGAVSEAQIEEIAALAIEVGADVPKFLEYMGVSALADLPASQFDRAKTVLNRKRKA